jgi:hypothetical protein
MPCSKTQPYYLFVKKCQVLFEIEIFADFHLVEGAEAILVSQAVALSPRRGRPEVRILPFSRGGASSKRWRESGTLSLPFAFDRGDERVGRIIARNRGIQFRRGDGEVLRNGALLSFGDNDCAFRRRR